MTPRLHLIRHGETEWSLSGQHTGRTEIRLTPRGEEEARRLGQRLRRVHYTHALASPLRRALQTCALAELSVATETEPDLAEWDYGDYEGRTPADIHRSRPGWNVFTDGAPNGETPEQVGRRVDRVVARVRGLGGDVAVFTHGHLGRALAVRWIGLPVAAARHFPLGTASLSLLGLDPNHDGAPIIELWNDRCARRPYDF
jgi:broad specificity phosphatase PhoE